MLQRVLEDEVMDSPDEALAYDMMDHRGVNVAFVDDLVQAGWNGADLLDLGTGTARIPIEICRRFPDTRIMAADMSVAMLDVARLNIEIASLMPQIQLDHTDAKEMHYEAGMFDAVISNSIVHHIPEPQAVLQEAVRVTREGGLLFFRDLLRPDSEGQLNSLVDTYARDESEHARTLFADSLRAALSLDEIGQLVSSLPCAESSVVTSSDRHWTWMARK